jgi:hypothetical protein
MSEHIFKATWRLGARHVAQVAWLMQAGSLALLWQGDLRGQGQPMKTWMRQSYEQTLKLAVRHPFSPGSAQSLPELAHIELFGVDGSHEVSVRLGAGTGDWRCRAYFFRGHDWLSVTRDIRVRS